MQGFQMLLRAIGIDLSPEGIKEMFSKVTAEDIKRLVGELGLNANEILAMPKIVATKLQEFEQRQIRILQLMEQNQHERYPGWINPGNVYRLPGDAADIIRSDSGTDRGSANGAGSGGTVSDSSDNG